MKHKKVLVIYFSQTGQLRNILDSLLVPLREVGIEIEFAEIRPQPAFPFPWSSDQFFNAFPESFMGIPCEIESVKSQHTNDFDLVIIGYSPWYLSPSIPMHAFMQSVEAAELLKGKPVITIIGCRNMWLMAQEKMKRYFLSVGGNLVGNVVFRDKAANLVSVLTIIRWMFKGKQESSRFLPRAGVSDKDIQHAEVFGKYVKEALLADNYVTLQGNLVESGALHIKPNLILFERNGSRIFKMWASKILKKGYYGDIRRKRSIRLFKSYLLIVLFLISPIANIIYLFIKIFISKKIKRDIQYFSQNKLGERK